MYSYAKYTMQISGYLFLLEIIWCNIILCNSRVVPDLYICIIYILKFKIYKNWHGLWERCNFKRERRYCKLQRVGQESVNNLNRWKHLQDKKNIDFKKVKKNWIKFKE